MCAARLSVNSNGSRGSLNNSINGSKAGSFQSKNGRRISNNEKNKGANSANNNNNPDSPTKSLAPDLDEVVDLTGLLTKMIYEEIPKATKGTFNNVKETLTPGFVRRARNKKIFSNTIETVEKEMSFLNEDASVVIVEELQHKNLERQRNKMIKEVIRANKHLRDEVKKAVEVAKETVKDGDFQAYAERRDAQIAEKKAAIEQKRLVQEEKERHDTQELRDWRQTHYAQQAKLLRAETDDLRRKANPGAKNQAVLDHAFDEWEHREASRIKQQVQGPPPAEKIGLPGKELGVFGIPMGEAANRKLGVPYENNIHDVHPLDAATDQFFEEENNKMLDAQSELLSSQQLYDSVRAESARLNESLERMCEQRDELERQLQQVNNDVLAVERNQAGPPKRLSAAHEVPMIHDWKNRSSDLHVALSELQYTIDKADVQKRKADAQGLSLAQTIAVLKQRNNTMQRNLDSINGPLGQMPMVLGRSLTQVPGMAETADAKGMLDAVSHQSKLIGIRAATDAAKRLTKDTGSLDQSLWLSRLDEGQSKVELERVVNRLANIAGRLSGAKLEAKRENLVDALKAFMVSSYSLAAVRTKVVGLLPWFKHHDLALSSYIDRYTSSNAMGGISFELEKDEAGREAYSNGVTLGENRVGYCTGSVDLPKDALWSVLITVTRQGSTSEFLSVDETDFVSVHMGPSTSSLTLQGTYFNKVNPATGTVLYDVRYIFRGSHFSFRFDFASSSMDPQKHLAVCTGIYEEYEMKALELVADPRIPTRTRVLSAFVKMIRIAENSGNMRLTKLIEEMLAVEHASTPHWDSKITNGVMQRYGKVYFLKLLRAEILMQQICDERSLEEKYMERERQKQLLSEKDLLRSAVLEQSKKKYVSKKRGLQREYIDHAKDLVGKRLVLYDHFSDLWRNLDVLDADVKWVDNGLKAKIEHRMQEYNEGHDKMGEPISMDLSPFKYYLSPQQVVDQETINNYRQKKAWEKRLHEITSRQDEVNAKFKKSFDIFRKKQERQFNRTKERLLQQFEDNIEDDAEVKASKPAAKRMLRALEDEVALDIQRGLVVMEEGVKPRVVIIETAKDRFIENWIRTSREQLNRQINDLEADMKQTITEHYNEVERQKNVVLAEISAEKHRLWTFIRKQMQGKKAALMQKVKFAPDVFKVAVPQARFCEHLKTKAWGNNYGKGVKCMDCGKELEDLQNEESQLMGYGTGEDPAMWDAIKRHRQNEHSFRFTSQEQLKEVERKRHLLEKERREMEEQEAYFYDFQDLKVVYEFDQRHQRSIKQAGVFRQGLQWTEEELQAFELMERKTERDRLNEQGLPETLMEQFDPLGLIGEPAPTFRAMDERRRAQYAELRFSIGRLHNFRKRIDEYKNIRFDLLSERELFAAVLESLHKESYVFDTELSEIEYDLDRTSQLMATFASMQRLWQQATMIQQQAKRDKMKAEMKRCGVGEDVKECQDKNSFLRDETRALLKSKLAIESRLADQEKNVAYYKMELEKKRAEYEGHAALSARLKYCMPGNLVHTKFGQLYVISYRPTDDIALVQLPFGNPPAKAYLHCREIIDAEVARQRAENLLMGVEDEHMQAFVSDERARTKKERYLMQKNEEGLRQYYEFVDLSKNEQRTMQHAIDAAVSEAFEITETKKYSKLQVKTIVSRLEKIKQERATKRKVYEGPPSGRPKKVGTIEAYRLRKELTLELKQKFILQAANEAEARTAAQLLDTRSDWVQTYSFAQMIDVIVLEMVKEIAQEAYSEGRIAKAFAERKSGIIFPRPVWMQYTVYSSLASIWRRRKDELRNRIEINKAASGAILTAAADAEAKKKKKEITPAEIERLKAIKRKIRAEKIRQSVLCEEMRQEELRSKAFYLWELKENLRERRLMREEERYSLQVRKDEQKKREEAESVYAVGGGPGANTNQQKEMSYDRRRQELKELALERRRRAEEQAFMTIEDELSEVLREQDRIERQRKAYMAQFGGDIPEDEEEEASAEEEQNVEHFNPKVPLKVPNWLTVPTTWDSLDTYKKNSYIRMMTRVRKKHQQAEKNAAREVKLLSKLEVRSYEEWENRFSKVEQSEMETELAMMNADEDLREAESRLIDLKDNIMRILLYCRDKGEEELKSKTDLDKKVEIARRRDRELVEAEEWLALCVKRSKQRDKLKRRVSNDCKWVDTESINGFHQRFATERLRARLYMTYFRKIFYSILNRAEIIATERRLMGLQEKISFNKDRILDRSTNMRRLLNDIRREEALRTKRSVLNQKLFGHSRRQVLRQRFGGWVRYFLWNRGNKEAFTLKYEVIKQQLLINRKFKEQLKTKAEKEEEQRRATEQERLLVSGSSKSRRPRSPQTLMQRHRERSVLCKFCSKFYIEAQNTSMSCLYHPKQFVMECPSSCPNPGLTVVCVAHRRRRWTCCDSVEAAATGCARRYHCPPDSDPIYDKVMLRVNQRDHDEVVALDAKLLEVRKHDYIGQVTAIKKAKRFEIEDTVDKDRQMALRYKDLKFV